MGAELKITLFVLLYAAVTRTQHQNATASNSVDIPTVTIDGVGGMNQTMQNDAVALLQNALINSEYPWSTFRESFTAKYPNLIWHVVVYKEYSVKANKYIELVVNNIDRYLLMATRKGIIEFTAADN